MPKGKIMKNFVNKTLNDNVKNLFHKAIEKIESNNNIVLKDYIEKNNHIYGLYSNDTNVHICDSSLLIVTIDKHTFLSLGIDKELDIKKVLLFKNDQLAAALNYVDSEKNEFNIVDHAFMVRYDSEKFNTIILDAIKIASLQKQYSVRISDYALELIEKNEDLEDENIINWKHYVERLLVKGNTFIVEENDRFSKDNSFNIRNRDELYTVHIPNYLIESFEALEEENKNVSKKRYKP